MNQSSSNSNWKSGKFLFYMTKSKNDSLDQKKKQVELRASKACTEISTLQKGVDFVTAFTYGFDIDLIWFVLTNYSLRHSRLKMLNKH